MGHHHFPTTSCSTFLKAQPSHPQFSFMNHGSLWAVGTLSPGRAPGQCSVLKGCQRNQILEPLHILLAVCPRARCFHSQSFGLLRGKQDLMGVWCKGGLSPCSAEELSAVLGVVT